MKDLQKPQPLFCDQIPAYMHEYIKEVINVEADGNCGYRAVAASLEKNKNEWPNNRKELLKELIEKEQFYWMLFIANDDYDMIIKEISWENGPCIFEYWMKMPQIGDVIANTYQRPLYFF
ncbi:28821_t:CDS:1 [Dentiscutata erythropus]|uniref:28821_t:CDS:1 n=1 Tax=Dentiscutata erythropus TaxID=1348616 RepID=A0A9N9K8Q2_9GLOM|nr:28821_t:CDS:1 [Dentiscutata erythropus]